MDHLKKLSFALILGLVTMILCVVLADAVLKMESSKFGMAVFLSSIIVLPVCARKFVKWRYTVINLPWFFVLYFIFTSPSMLNWRGRFFCGTGALISLYGPLTALLTAFFLWGLESIIYAVCNIVLRIRKKGI